MVVKNCVNTWCKYHGGFYCQENCGSYVPAGTALKNISKSKLNAKDYALFIDHILIARGTFEDMIKGHEDDIVTSVNYDGNTFCVSV